MLRGPLCRLPPHACPAARPLDRLCVCSSVQSSVGSWLLGGALAALLPSFRHYAYALTLTLPFARQRLAEKTCADTDGSSTAAVCGTGATCSEGGTGDGYTCECDDGYAGADVLNGDATCTGEQCFVARSAACREPLHARPPVPAAAICATPVPTPSLTPFSSPLARAPPLPCLLLLWLQASPLRRCHRPTHHRLPNPRTHQIHVARALRDLRRR